MYVPPRSRESRIPVLHDAVDRLRFGTLVTITDGQLHATHLPMLVEPRPAPLGTLIGHIARNNPQWQGTAEPLAGIASFLGPNFYVTPSWYATKAETGKVVPTWNYIAVEVRGEVRFFRDRERLLPIVERLTRAQESARERPWAVNDAPPDYVEAMLAAIVGFELTIDTLEGAWKLGQHKSEADRAGVAAGLSASSDDPAVRALLPELAHGASPPDRASIRHRRPAAGGS